MSSDNDIQTFAGIFSKPSGNPYACLTAADVADENSSTAPTDARKRPVDKRREPASDREFADELSVTPDRVVEILSRYLPTAARARDRKTLADVSEEFAVRLNTLKPHQRKFATDRLTDMAPRGGRQLEAARTTFETIRSALEKLLDDARSR